MPDSVRIRLGGSCWYLCELLVLVKAVVMFVCRVRVRVMVKAKARVGVT